MTDYPRCATCRWWEERRGKAQGRCRRVEQVDDQSLFFAESSDPYEDGRLLTDPQFGCVLHEPKADQ